ncbi:uncharacterized protein BX664DRAFT_371716 [Halteromyces radiatus]|uniref:uncharacterized protein n=1 Tax=Halteromyces radiatus TaxID=101107 RepID=UPI002220D3B7|nr:uncharacterized protein BX664DRAFT_371716 [Halteromyces radiatus]KAI8092894.1 hypothetical protein BX664DRAFT_371716 [Halteromyces radiatus]
MTIGNLQVTAVTIRGLAENGLNNINAFLGCYIVSTDKHRTQSQRGPEPQWNQTLTIPIPEGHNELHLEIINENPSDSGVIGVGRFDLTPVIYQNQREEVWIPIHPTNNNASTLGHLLIRIEKQHYQPSSDYPPPPPNYSGSFASNEYPQEKQHHQQQQPPAFGQPDRQSSFASLGPEQPIPDNYGAGNPPPFTPPATSSNDPPAYPSAYPPSYPQHNQQQGFQMPGTSQPDKASQDQDKSTDWKKYGGIALGAAGALGLGAFVAHEIKEHKEEKHHQHHYKH